MRWFIGIDPGLYGAISLIDDEGALWECWDSPSYPKGGGARGNDADVFGMCEILRSARAAAFVGGAGQITVIIERPFLKTDSAPAAMAAVKLARSHALWEGIIVTLGLRYENVLPQRWHKDLNIPPKADKKVVLAKARGLWPESPWLKLEKHQDRAEAALIAEFGRRTHGE